MQSSSNVTNSGMERTFIFRGSDTGVHVTFPNGGTWGVCTSWNISRVAFHELHRMPNWTLWTTDEPATKPDLCGSCSEDTGNYCTTEGEFCPEVQSGDTCPSSYLSYCKFRG
eukprot:sb/3477054/